jgi:hypothetical protein
MRFKKVDWRLVGIALVPALAASVAVSIVGRVLGVQDSTIDRIAQILFFPIFLATFHVLKRRRAHQV